MEVLSLVGQHRLKEFFQFFSVGVYRFIQTFNQGPGTLHRVQIEAPAISRTQVWILIYSTSVIHALNNMRTYKLVASRMTVFTADDIRKTCK